MDNKVMICDLDGNTSEVEILDIFTVEGYEGKEYVLYTQNKEVGEDNVEVMVSILKQDGDKTNFEYIEDEAEWEAVQKVLGEMENLNG